MNWIEHIIEPKRLLLTWQSKSGDRMRRIIGELIRKEDDVLFQYNTSSKDFEEAKNLGFWHYEAFPEDQKIYPLALDVFMRRLPPRSRGDFQKYLEAIRIPVNTGISNFALLGYSGAKLPDDDFSVVHPFDEATGSFELLTEVSGTRYYKDNFLDLQLGSCVELIPEPTNDRDENAIQVFYAGKKIGYINRGQQKSFALWMKQNKIEKAVIERINGSTDKPSIYIFVSVKNYE